MHTVDRLDTHGFSLRYMHMHMSHVHAHAHHVHVHARVHMHVHVHVHVPQASAGRRSPRRRRQSTKRAERASLRRAKGGCALGFLPWHRP